MKDNESPLKIILWCPYGIRSSGGGAGISARKIYEGFDLNLVRVTLVHGYAEQLNVKGIEKTILICPLSKPYEFFNHINFLLRSFIWLFRNARKFDVFHGIDAFDATVLPAFWAKKLGIKSYIKPASSSCGLEKTKSWRRILGRHKARIKYIKSLSGVISISNSVKAQLLTHGIEERLIHAIPNGVDLDKFFHVNSNEKHQIRDKLGLDRNAYYILTVADIRPLKRTDWLIQALSELPIDMNFVKLLIVGGIADQIYMKSISEMINNLNLTDRITFTGAISDTSSYFKASDVFSLPSVSEGLSNSLLEALASGLPAIVTPVSGSIDLVKNGFNGFLVESPSEISNSIAFIVNNPGVASDYARNSRKIANSYSLHIVRNKHYQLFKNGVYPATVTIT